jgi:hypothetical protein
VPYFHVVFTLPAAIADIACQNKTIVYDLLFKASAETLIAIAADPKHLGARIGITSVLHTWGSAMTHHPHVHMIVPGGGISLDGGRWVACRSGFFLPVRVLSRLFRRLFLERLLAAHQAGHLKFFGNYTALADAQAFVAYLAPLRRSEWVVCAKRPFGGPQAALAYLSRYMAPLRPRADVACIYVLDHALAQRADRNRTHGQLLSWMRLTTPPSSRQADMPAIDDLSFGYRALG